MINKLKKALDNQESIKSTILMYGENDFFEEEVNIIDWGCGQGIGTISLLDDLNNEGVNLNISKAILIEPSIVALKRASLHVSKYNIDYFTINKDFDSLQGTDFKLPCKSKHFIS